MRNAAIIIAAITILVSSSPSYASEHMFQVGEITVSHPWSRDSAGQARAGAAFMVIHNKGQSGDKLIAATADIAKKTELHEHQMDQGVMRMRQIKGGIPLPASKATSLVPGGYHVMFMGLHAPLKEGSKYPLTLTFEHAGTLTVTVEVKAAGAQSKGHKMEHSKHKERKEHDDHMKKKD